MKRMINDPNSRSDAGTDDMWTYSQQFGKVMLLYHEVEKDCSDELPSSGIHRLFFLLKGKARLKIGSEDEYLLNDKEFTLLPPGCPVVCSALVSSGYVIINCNRIKISSNRSYLAELKKEGKKGIVPCRQLPIRGRFMKVLTDFEYYPVSENMYPSLYDILFIYMRILYSKEELLSFLYPVLFGDGGEARIEGNNK